MKRDSLLPMLAAAASVLMLATWRRPPEPIVPTMLSFRIGQSFEDVVRASTYPVMQRSAVPEAETGMTFRLKCTDGCSPGEKPPYLFLVDLGIGNDVYESKRGDPKAWEASYPGNAVTAGPARFRCPDGAASLR